MSTKHEEIHPLHSDTHPRTDSQPPQHDAKRTPTAHSSGSSPLSPVGSFLVYSDHVALTAAAAGRCFVALRACGMGW
jgi:hypothetical protein